MQKNRAHRVPAQAHVTSIKSLKRNPRPKSLPEKLPLDTTTLAPIFVSSLPPKRYHKVNAAHVVRFFAPPKERSSRPSYGHPYLHRKKKKASITLLDELSPPGERKSKAKGIVLPNRLVAPPSTVRPKPATSTTTFRNPFLTIQPRRQKLREEDGGVKVHARRPQVRRYSGGSSVMDVLGSEAMATVVLPEHVTRRSDPGPATPIKLQEGDEVRSQSDGIRVFREGVPFLSFSEDGSLLPQSAKEKPDYLHNIVVFSTENPYPLMRFGYVYGVAKGEAEEATTVPPQPVYSPRDGQGEDLTTTVPPLTTTEKPATTTTMEPTTTGRSPRHMTTLLPDPEEARPRKRNVTAIVGESAATRFVFRFGDRGTILVSYPVQP